MSGAEPQRSRSDGFMGRAEAVGRRGGGPGGECGEVVAGFGSFLIS